jgi:serine/threonine protein kinase
MYGGAFIDSGTYGCTFLPPLLCAGENPNKIKKTDVSKIGLRKAGLEYELRFLLRIRNNIPNAPAYFSMPVSDKLCHADKNQPFFLNPPKELLKCDTEGRTIDSQQLWSYRMTFAGNKDSDQGLFNSDDALWKYGKHLLEGLTLLTVEGIVHGDLHNGNVLVDNNYLPRIIDFGFAQDAYSISVEQLVDLFKPNQTKDPTLLGYSQYPPEETLFKAINNGESSMQVINKFFRTPQRQRLINTMIQVYGLTEQEIKQQLIDFTKNSISFRENNPRLFWKNNWHKYDSYSAGYILIRKLSRLMIAGRESRDIKHLKQMKEAIKGLCNLNPLKRLSTPEALAIWDSPQNPILQKYAKNWL